MEGVTGLHGMCPKPFFQEDLFPSSGGFVGGRFCQKLGTLSCCLPCPLADWRYGDAVNDKIKVANWLSVAILPLCVFLLVSYAVLPVKWTHRHYLNICFTLGICFIQIAFIIPLGVKPPQCHNEITPNDMHSNLSCAWTGSLLLFGGWMVVVWGFIRTVAFHLQVCWEVILGSKFMWGSFICGWGVPAIGTTVMLIYTGVSFRFGEMCHINIQYSMQDYWIPIVSFSAAALVLQIVTMGYCIHIYVRSIFDKNPTTTGSSNLASYSASIGTLTARQAYRRIRRVLQLQWRGVAVVLIIIGNVIYFAIIFIRMNSEVVPSAANEKKAFPWLLCLASTNGDKNACLKQADVVGPSEGVLLAVMILLSLVGMWTFILFARPSMFLGWIDLFRARYHKKNEFVSADPPRYDDSRAYEMLSGPGLPSLKTPEPYLRSPSPARLEGTHSPVDRSYGREVQYGRPPMSFSRPLPPSSNSNRDWDPKATFASSHGRGYSGDKY